MRALVFALVFFSWTQIASAYEASLFGIPLYAPYDATIAELAQKYGKPIQSERQDSKRMDAFEIKALQAHVVVRASGGSAEVTWIEIQGFKPIPNLAFFEPLNLGFPADDTQSVLGFPTSKGPSSDGYILQEYEFSNFSVETKKGIVASIAIFAPSTKPPRFKADVLKSECRSRFPLRPESGLYFAEIETTASTRLKKGAVYFPGHFLLDTGWADVSISQRLCKRIGCRIEKNRTDFRASGGAVTVAREFVVQPNFYVDSDKVYPDAHGVLGTGFLGALPIVVDLEHEYACVVRGSLAPVAAKLRLTALSAKYLPDPGPRIEAKFNGRTIPDVLIDTGSDTTSLRPEHITALKLIKKGSETRSRFKGKYEAVLYGPSVQVSIGKSSAMLDTISEAPEAYLQKVGTDFLRGKIFALDEEGGKFYIGEP